MQNKTDTYHNITKTIIGKGNKWNTYIVQMHATDTKRHLLLKLTNTHLQGKIFRCHTKICSLELLRKTIQKKIITKQKNTNLSDEAGTSSKKRKPNFTYGYSEERNLETANSFSVRNVKDMIHLRKKRFTGIVQGRRHAS